MKRKNTIIIAIKQKILFVPLDHPTEVCYLEVWSQPWLDEDNLKLLEDKTKCWAGNKKNEDFHQVP